MKKIVLCLFATLMALPALAQIQNLRIFYVNGIGNTRPQAEDGARSLQRVLSSLTGNVRVEPIYNPIGLYGGGLSLINGGDTCDTFNFSTGEFLAIANTGLANILSVTESTALSKLGTCILGDLGELAASKINEENYDSAFEALKPANLTASSQASALAFVNTYLVEGKEKKSVLSPSLDIANRASRAVKAGNKVLIVAHSQGNLIANLAWAQLVAKHSLTELSNIRILNVANTSIFSLHDADITHNFDLEISGNLRALGQFNKRNTLRCGSLQATTSCFFRVVSPSYAANIRQGGLISSWDNHNFQAAYLSGFEITKVGGGTTTFADAIFATTRSLLESMGAIAPIPPTPNIPPTASFVPNVYSGSFSTEFNFRSNLSRDPDGQIVNYAWNFGDGTTRSGAQLQEVIHSYGAVGQYTVTLTVTDNQGATGSDALQVSITATPQPDLVPSLVTVSPASVAPGGSVNVSWRITNSGNGNASASSTGIRLLPAATSGNGSAANTLLSVATGALASGSVANQTQAITIPANTAPGSYVVVVAADNVASSTLGQSNISNDFARSSAFNVGSAPVVSITFSAGRLPATGVTANQCYQAGSDVLVACNSAGALALNPQQDGHRTGINSLSYSEVPNPAGGNFPRTSCVKDNVTGLMWEGKEASGARSTSSFYTNFDVNDTGSIAQVASTNNAGGYANTINSMALCGFTDWRLPSTYELQTIMRYDPSTDLALDPLWFFNSSLGGLRNAPYWSNTSFGGNRAYYVRHEFDDQLHWLERDRQLPVRLVRGAPESATNSALGNCPRVASSTRYLLAGAEVSDRSTGLVWSRCSVGQAWNGNSCEGTPITFSHEEALRYAALQTGWRLPNVKELSSILESSCSSPKIDSTAFPATVSNHFWTSTPHVFNTAWFVGFNSGTIGVSNDLYSRQNYYRYQQFPIRLVKN